MSTPLAAVSRALGGVRYTAVRARWSISKPRGLSTSSLWLRPADSSDTAPPSSTGASKPQEVKPPAPSSPTLLEAAGGSPNLFAGKQTLAQSQAFKFNEIELPVAPMGEVLSVGTLVREEDDLTWSESLGIPEEQYKRLMKRILHVRRTSNMTRKGKMPSMYALVVVGTGRGVAGYGEGKGEEVADAVRKATSRAIKNLTYFPRYDNRTIYHDINHKFKATDMTLLARPPGFGRRVNPYIYEICYCLGIQDIAGKVSGSRNPMNVIKCFFEAMQTQRTPEDLAMARGKKLVDVNRVYYGGSP
ncbi:28S ribosomal protein S5, mitochondrial [Dimargaris verticillata]|uniref:Small ribosomal subunit protein uS5m n=1 Tax=Dimargaris verticillata TaxID=2761393 RepID=A0A9W8B4I3_9FUNG|nr:28S ribosomal protein S5, mitochondrial [Dimargaris verticillata]